MIVYGILLVVHHVQADRNQSFADESLLHTPYYVSLWDRVKAGPNALTTLDKILFGALILLAFELLDYISGHLGYWIHAKLIPVRGKHLDELSGKDVLFVGLNKAATAPFVYIVLRYAYYEPNIVWSIHDITLVRRIVVVVWLLYVWRALSHSDTNFILYLVEYSAATSSTVRRL